MENSKLCRICLIRDVRMYDLQSYPLNTYFEPVSDINLLTIVNLPPYACYECAVLLKKFYFFKQKCLRSQSILFGLLNNTGKIDPAELSIIDRECLLLSSNLSICHIPQYTCLNVVHSEISVNSKHDNSNVKSNCTVDVSCVKLEDDCALLSPKRIDSSDDDEPLSLHKEKKVNELQEIKIEEDNIKELEFIIDPGTPTPLTETEEVSISARSRRDRPKKLKSVKTILKTEHDYYHNDNTLDLEDYITVINLSIEEQIEEINKRKQSSNYLKSPYQCNLCYKGFIDTDAWNHHVGKHSVTAGDIECPICKFRFKTKRAFQKHSSNHEKKYACKSCPYISSNITQAKQHQGWHKGVTYKCKFCDDIFTIWTSYMSHIRIKHPSEFICGICGYSFVSKLGVTMHKSMMHKDIIEKGEQLNEDGPYCEECDVKFISSEAFKRHMIMSTKHTRTTKIISGCRICGKSFNNAEELRLHHKEHARKRPKNYGKKPPNLNFPAKCEHCTEIIGNGREHWSHYRRMHPDKIYPIQKNYVCDICGKSFRGNSFLVYHKRTHTEERAYKCGQCGKAFFNRANLQMHEKTHSESRPYPCTVCSKAFKCKGALDRHFRSHTGQKPYECEVCGKAFTQSNSRKLHVSTVHLKQPTPYISRRRNKNIDKETPPQQFIY